MERNGPQSRMHRWGRGMYRFRRAVAAAWFILFLLMLPFAFRLPSLLQQNGFTPHNSPALQSAEILEKKLGISSTTLDIVIAGKPGDNLTTAAAKNAMMSALDPMLSKPYVQAVSFQLAARKPGQEHIQSVTVQLRDKPEDVLRYFDEIREALPAIPGYELYISGNTAVLADMNEAVKKDIVTAELIGIPLALLILRLAFGSFAAAALPVIVGVCSVAVTMGLLYGAALWNHSLSNFLPNAVTMLGLAVGMDYALFLVSRFREELDRGDPEAAVAAACHSSGRAVIYSGAAVCIGFVAMAFIDLPIFTSFSLGGIAVVIISVAAANTLLPSLLGMTGTRLRRRPAISPAPQQTVWHRLSDFVMSRPGTVAVLATLLLLLAMLPLSRVQAGIPSAEVLPPSYESRTGDDLLKQAYDERELYPIVAAVKLPASYQEIESIEALKSYSDEIRALPDVQRVESYLSLAPRGDAEEIAVFLQSEEFNQELQGYRVASGQWAAVAIVPRYGDIQEQTVELIERLRSLTPEALTVYITGIPPYKLDIMQAIQDGIPYVLLFVFAATYAVLMIAFRSLLLPLKAVLMNVLSLGAGLGIVVQVVQEGTGASLLGISSTGSVFILLPILIFCVVFGISMDYEVILLSRIKERYEATGDNERSTMEGLSSTGGLITSAALILAAVAGAFVFTDNEMMKAIGLGLTVCILLDASIIRMLLVPAFMKLMGRANWWAPRWLLPKASRKSRQNL
ncbi:MMPL family transporter [Paenibacillus algicola]|nr:MMPL family transporter [Paenibacillus algicola]